VPVTDPLVLARLTEQGDRARSRAVEDARDTLSERIERDREFILTGVNFGLALSIAAVGYPQHVERLVFGEETLPFLARRFRELLRPGPTFAFEGGPRSQVHLDGIVARMLHEQYDWRWTVAATRTGAVAVTGSVRGRDDAVDLEVLMEHVARPAWTIAADLVERFGGSGRTFAVVRTFGTLMIVHRRSAHELPPTEFDEWTAEPRATDGELAHVQRQLLRAAGFDEWEPAD
jgi:hypothetical protein